MDPELQSHVTPDTHGGHLEIQAYGCQILQINFVKICQSTYRIINNLRQIKLPKNSYPMCIFVMYLLMMDGFLDIVITLTNTLSQSNIGSRSGTSLLNMMTNSWGPCKGTSLCFKDSLKCLSSCQSAIYVLKKSIFVKYWRMWASSRKGTTYFLHLPLYIVQVFPLKMVTEVCKMSSLVFFNCERQNVGVGGGSRKSQCRIFKEFI